MSDLLDGLERDLVAAMRRHEAQRRPFDFALPSVKWLALARTAAVTAAIVLVLVLVAGRGGDIGDERAVPADNAATRLLPNGAFARASGDFQLLVSRGRYQLLRCNGRDCGFDIFDGGVRGSPKVRTGALERRGDLAIFSDDATCRAGGPPQRGVYRVNSQRGRVLLTRVTDRCRGRAAALDGSTWQRKP